MEDKTFKLLARARNIGRNQSSTEPNAPTYPPQMPASETNDDTEEASTEDVATEPVQTTTVPPADDTIQYSTEVIVIDPTQALYDELPTPAPLERARTSTVDKATQPTVVEPTLPRVVEDTRARIVGSIKKSVFQPLAGGSRDVPKAGGSRDIPKAGGSRDTPMAGGSRDTPMAGGSRDIPKAGGSRDTPMAGGSRDIPKAGGSRDTPMAGGSRDIPKAGGSRDIPMAGGSRDIPKAGGSRDNPKPGGSRDTPMAGGSRDIPKAGGSRDNPMPGGSRDIPKAGGSRDNPMPGGSRDTPMAGIPMAAGGRVPLIGEIIDIPAMAGRSIDIIERPRHRHLVKRARHQSSCTPRALKLKKKLLDQHKAEASQAKTTQDAGKDQTVPESTKASIELWISREQPSTSSTVGESSKDAETLRKANILRHVLNTHAGLEMVPMVRPTRSTVEAPIAKTMEEPKKPMVIVEAPKKKTDDQKPSTSAMAAPTQAPVVTPKEGAGIWPIAIENLIAESPAVKKKSKKKRKKSITAAVVPETVVTAIKLTAKEKQAIANEAIQAALEAMFSQFPDPIKSGLRVAMIGQSPFAVDVMERLHSNGHTIVGVFTVMDDKNREDPLAVAAKEYNIPIFKYKSWRIKGQIKPDVWEQYKSVDAELNVLAYCSQYIPMEVINYPSFKSICYHPSILPRHRGAAAINWTLISGDTEAGFTIFWADDGLDTGPILLQEKIKIQDNDTVDTLYRKFLYPAGVTAMEIAVDMIAEGVAPSVAQNEQLATYDPLLNKPELMTIDFKKTGREIHNFIRGLDSVPGARFFLKASAGSTQYEEAHVFGSSLWKKPIPNGTLITIDHGPSGLLHEEGIILFGSDGVAVNVTKIKIGGRFKPAHALDKANKQQVVEFTEEEAAGVESIRKVWQAILKMEVDEDTDFFACGAGSMDVVRLIEEVKELMGMFLDNEEIFMSPVFEEFSKAVILKSRRATTIDGILHVDYNGLDVIANNRVIRVPTQMFIDGKFVDASNGKTTDIINPTDETVICKVAAGTVEDVDKAVAAAKKAFEEGEWGRISARERGNLLVKLSYFMEESKEELATLEAVDSGAVYTLALKTHVGMSIEAWRYFGGWSDKIQGSTIPISDARPNKNLSFTKKEPIGVCGLITPWNYPLMMLSWKMAACLAAGNTVVIKPAQVCPLTALKFAELTVRAGIPPGVINIVTGSGSVVGNAIASHPDVRKVGFTGSTDIGKVIMKTCTENLKKISLELGGKSPLVIFADCDMDKAVKLGMQSVFFNKGENCIAAGRIFVESSIYTEFIHRVLKETKKIVIGAPLDRATSHGPQNHLAHLKKLEEFVQAGLDDGARLVYGGKRLPRPGLFFPPTILADVEDNMFVAKEESFGPIMCISKFDNGDVDGVIKRANSTEYGLASGVFTQDISKALKFADKIEAGTVFINTYNKTDVAAPFGGFKQSGFGKDLGQEALNEYLKTKTVTIEY